MTTHPEAAMTREQVLEEALRSAIKIADEAREEWDKAPSGMKAGKLLIALSGNLSGYRHDIDAVHAALASTRQDPAPAADAEEVASECIKNWEKISAPVYNRDLLVAAIADALRRYAGHGVVTGCWLEEESRAVGRHVALCGVHLSDEEKLLFRSGWRAALRRPITDAQVSAASEAYLVERDGGFVPDMRAALEAAARAKSGEKGGAR